MGQASADIWTAQTALQPGRLLRLTFLSMMFAGAAAAAPPPTASSPTAEVTLSAQAQRDAGLRTVRLSRSSHRATWRAYGRVLAPAPLLAEAHSLAQSQSALQQARAQVAASASEYHRLAGLFARHANVSRRQLEAARARWQSDRASLQAATVGTQSARDEAASRWGATVAGWLWHRGATYRALSTGKMRLLRLVVPSQTSLPPGTHQVILVTADEHAIEAAWIASAPGQADDVQGAAFFVRADHQLDRLPYGSSVLGRVEHGPVRSGVVVPASAVVWSGGKAWVYLRVTPQRFRRVPLSTRVQVPEGWFESRRPVAGAELVVRGAQVLYSQQVQSVAPPATGDDDDD